MTTIETVNALKDRAAKARDNARKLDAAVSALQSVCEHSWKETGYDPRGGTTYYQCDNCGAEKRI